ncbi:MAG: protein kinase [Acidobacteriota bacterium]
MSLSLARIDDQYEIVAKIKQGGMGEIYKVRHRLLDEIRVVKVLHSELEGDSELNERFAREARAAIQLRHPNIVQIFDFTLDDSGTGLIVMEFIDGVDLQQMIAQPRRPSIPLALEIARQGLRALGFLHRNGFVHRDVSPDNLMLSRDVEGRPLVKIIDLGIAKRRGSDPQLTASGMFLGKFRYSSPEHFGVAGSNGIEARSDLYTFGLVLYELLTGCSPVQGESTSELIAGHLFQPPRGFNETDPELRIPDALRRVVLKALAKAPDERFDSAEELIQRLEAIQRDHPIDGEVLTEAGSFIEDQPIAAAETTTDGPGHSDDMQEDSTELAQPSAGWPSQPPAGQVDSLLNNARGLFEANHLPAARSQLETILELAPDHTEARQLMETLDAKERASSRAIDRLVAEVDQLLQSGRLIEADRVLFQARETHGSTAELTTMKARLDAQYQRGVETEVRALMSRADLLTRDDDYTQAYEVLEKARAAAPPRSALIGEVDRAITGLRDAQQEQRSITAVTSRLDGMIERQELAAARDMLARAEVASADEPAFSALRERLERVTSGRVQELVQQAGLAHEGQRFETAVSLLQQVLEIAPDNTWIRKRLARAEAAHQEQVAAARRQREMEDELVAIRGLIADGDPNVATRRLQSAISRLGNSPAFAELEQQLAEMRAAAEVRFFCRQAEEARAEDDILKARLLVARALELEPSDNEAAALAKALDREHRAAELRLSAAAEPSLPPEQAAALAEIQAKRAAGQQVTAWRLLQEAIETFGEVGAFTAMRRQIAEEILDDGGGGTGP